MDIIDAVVKSDHIETPKKNLDKAEPNILLWHWQEVPDNSPLAP